MIGRGGGNFFINTGNIIDSDRKASEAGGRGSAEGKWT